MIRIGRDTDIDACVRLAFANVVGLQGDWSRTLTTTVEDAGHNRELFVADLGGSIVGYARIVHLDHPLDVDGVLPVGWFLLGVVVNTLHRRAGIGTELTVARIEWLRSRAKKVYYFTGLGNVASTTMHARLGFTQLPAKVRLTASADSQSEQSLWVLNL